MTNTAENRLTPTPIASVRAKPLTSEAPNWSPNQYSTAVVVTRNFVHVLQLANIAQHPALYGLPANALNLPRYRPSERRAQRAASLALAGGGAAAADEAEDTASAGNAGNGRNGSVSRRADATKTISGGEE